MYCKLFLLCFYYFLLLTKICRPPPPSTTIIILMNGPQTPRTTKAKTTMRTDKWGPRMVFFFVFCYSTTSDYSQLPCHVTQQPLMGHSACKRDPVISFFLYVEKLTNILFHF